MVKLIIKKLNVVVIPFVGELECSSLLPTEMGIEATFRVVLLSSAKKPWLSDALKKIEGFDRKMFQIKRLFPFDVNLKVEMKKIADQIEKSFSPVTGMIRLGWDESDLVDFPSMPAYEFSSFPAEWSHPLIVGESGHIESGQINLASDPTVIVVTDGEPALGEDVKSLLEELKKKGLTVMVIGFGSGSEEL